VEGKFGQDFLRSNERRVPRGLKSVRENSSFAPLGLDHFPLAPTAYARGLYSFAASRLETAAFFHPESAKLDLTHTLKPAIFLWPLPHGFKPCPSTNPAAVRPQNSRLKPVRFHKTSGWRGLYLPKGLNNVVKITGRPTSPGPLVLP